MIKVPVTIGFDSNQVIGFLEIDESKLLDEPNFHFAIGYKANEWHEDGEGKIRVTSFEVKEVGLITDDKFQCYPQFRA